MQTKKGAFRSVVIGKNKVYKIATLRYFWSAMGNIPRMVKNGDTQFIGSQLAWGLKTFLRGVQENWTEYRCWRRVQAPFLAPVEFSVGVINIETKLNGQVPTNEELDAIFRALPHSAFADLQHVEGHCLQPNNFVKTRLGLQLVDYDDGNTNSGQKLPFTVFLERWHKELDRALLPKITS